MFSRLFITLILLTGSLMLQAQESDDAIHEELRGLLDGIEVAINSEQYGDLKQFFHAGARVTTINQEVISSNSEIEPYFNTWFGPGGYLKSLKMTLEADVLTEFYADGTFGIVRGSGEEDYVLSDTRSFPMKTRWTATVFKDADGAWKILTLHIGTNFMDNPILAVAEESRKYFTAGGAIAGVLLGLLCGFFWGKRKRAA